MNEELEAAVPEPREEASTLRPEDLRNADLTDEDLTKVKRLLPQHLAGADLTCARLPEEIANFPALGQVAAVSNEARKIFVGLLAACVYSWLVIGTTTDIALILNTASSPLPIINTPLPTAGFYVVGGTLLAAVYCYLHFYLQRLWRTLATLPAVFPDGTDLDDRTDPWLLTNLVRADFERLRADAPPLARLENLLAIMLAWGLVPVTLLALWARYLPAHGWRGTSWLVFLIGVTTLFGGHTYRLARAALQGKALPNAGRGDREQGIFARAWHEVRRLRPDKLTIWITVGLVVCSLSAFRDNPRDPYTWVAKSLNALNFIGVRTYADMREVNVAEQPDGWDGKDWSKVRRVDLRDRNLAFAQAGSAFLANADLRGSNLTGADLTEAQLQGADLRDAQLQGVVVAGAQLQGARFGGAQLQGAVLNGAQLQGADLSSANLTDAWLQEANLEGATLASANLTDASFLETNLRGANLESADLTRADLEWTHLEGATLRSATLKKASLPEAFLAGAVLSGANLEGASLPQARLFGADLSNANLRDASLLGAYLTDAKLEGAVLAGVDLREAELPNASGLTREQLKGTRCDRLTVLPQGFDPRRDCGSWQSGAIQDEREQQS